MINYKYLNHTFFLLFTGTDIPIVPLIKTGTFKEVLELNPVFDSMLLNQKNNEAEGLVLKPVNPAYMPNGSRVILKKKNPKFSEKQTKSKKPRVNITLSSKAKKELININNYITENRLKNVLSKEDIISQKEFGKLNGLLIQDVLLDYQKENEISLKNEYKEEWKPFQKEISKYCANLIRPNFLNIIDNNF